MLVDLELLSLKERRSMNGLSFFYKVVEGLVPPIPPEDCDFFNFSNSFFDEQLNLENQNKFDPLTKEKKTRSSSNGTNQNQLRQWTEIC